MDSSHLIAALAGSTAALMVVLLIVGARIHEFLELLGLLHEQEAAADLEETHS